MLYVFEYPFSHWPIGVSLVLDDKPWRIRSSISLASYLIGLVKSTEEALGIFGCYLPLSSAWPLLYQLGLKSKRELRMLQCTHSKLLEHLTIKSKVHFWECPFSLLRKIPHFSHFMVWGQIIILSSDGCLGIYSFKKGLLSTNYVPGAHC